MSADSTRSASHGLRVLVVEDELLVALMLEDMLAELGHEVAAIASDLGKALRLASDGRFDLAILDVNLSGSYVYPVADKLSERGIPFAFASGYGQQSLDERHRHRPTLQKPFEESGLKRIIADALKAG